jgi:hypothetical protein
LHLHIEPGEGTRDPDALPWGRGGDDPVPPVRSASLVVLSDPTASRLLPVDAEPPGSEEGHLS